MAFSLTHLLYLILVTLISFFCQFYFFPTHFPWLIGTALAFALLPLIEDFFYRLRIMIMLAITLLVLVSLTLVFSPYPLLSGINLAIITFFCAIKWQDHPESFGLFFIISFFVILTNIQNAHDVNLISQLSMIALGGLITILLQFIFLINFVSNEFYSLQRSLLIALKKLAHQLFSSLIDQSYMDKVYLYEHSIHNYRLLCNHLLSKLDRYIKDYEKQLKNKSIVHNLNCFYELYASLLSMSQLRNREVDKATIVLASTELNQFYFYLDQYFNQLIAKQHNNEHLDKSLQQIIAALEDVYHNVIAVAAKESFIYILFIDSLKSIKEKMREITT